MLDLYKRLKSVGFDQAWLRSAVLPDWWEDELAEVPFNRASAEAAIAGFLGFPIRALRDPAASLTKPPLTNVCFKRNKKGDVEDLGAALQVVRQTAKIVAAGCAELPAFAGVRTAAEIRETILGSYKTVTLGRLVEYCWSVGVAVINVTEFPNSVKRFEGVAMYEGSRPTVVLSSKRDGPAWLAFDLAHELGHVMLGHTQMGGVAVVDAADWGADVEDDNEFEANEFALELLTGHSEGVVFKSGGFKAHQVGQLAAQYSREVAPGIDPGVLVLAYCKSTAYWGVAQGALETIGDASGGHDIVAAALAKHLDFDTLSDNEVRFLSGTCKLSIEVPVS